MSCGDAMEIFEPAIWRHELHELCQPLTRLQWRLEIGQQEVAEGALRATIEGGLEDAKELMDHVRRMRALLARVQRRETSESEL
jgi:hypothetical protein